MVTSTTCHRCGAALAATARYCGRCGRASPREELLHESALRHELHHSGRVAYAIATVFVGVIASVLAGWFLGEGELTAPSLIVALVVQVASGLLAVRFLEPGALRKTVPIPTRTKWLLLAIPIGAGTGAVAIGYVWLLHLAAGGVGAGEGDELDRIGVLFAVVGAPLLEEWLCRGVLWAALTRVAEPRRTVIVTAMLFAVMHGLQGVYLAFPHRFFGGLALGWLRLKSGSLVPCVIAHATWNAIAVMVG